MKVSIVKGMKKSCIVLFLSLVGCCGLQAQNVLAGEVFCQMPDSIVPYLTENNRLDFIDFLDSKMKAEVHNTFEGKSEMTVLTDDYLSVRLNVASQLDMRLLNVAEAVDSCRKIVCLVRTYGTDVRESTISFYSARWRPLAAVDYLPALPPMFTAVVGEQEATLTVTPVRKLDFPASEEQQELQEVSIMLKWDGKRFNNL